MIQLLEDLLRSYNLEFGRQWEDHLPYIEFSYNNGHQTMISMAPYKALYGKKNIKLLYGGMRLVKEDCWDQN
jgi:hypothetical protein